MEDARVAPGAPMACDTHTLGCVAAAGTEPLPPHTPPGRWHHVAQLVPELTVARKGAHAVVRPSRTRYVTQTQGNFPERTRLSTTLTGRRFWCLPGGPPCADQPLACEMGSSAPSCWRGSPDGPEH